MNRKNWEKIFPKYICGKELVSGLYKELLQLKKKPNQPIFKNEQFEQILYKMICV